MELLTIATSCPLSVFLQSAPSWAYQEYCTLISFSACYMVTFPVLCVSCYHRDRRCSKARGRGIEAGLWGNSPCWLEKPEAGIYSSKWKEGIVWSDLTVCPEGLRKRAGPAMLHSKWVVYRNQFFKDLRAAWGFFGTKLGILFARK